MLLKKYRLSRDYFKNLLQSRRFFHSEHFTLRVAPSPSGPRIGVSVSKKVSKKAVIRNRIRRRVYSVLEDFLPSLEDKLFLIIAKPKADTIKGDALKQELAGLLKKG